MAYMGEVFQFSLGQFFLEANLVGPSCPVQVIEHDGIKDQNDESYIGTVCPPCFVPSRLFIDTQFCDVVFPVAVFICRAYLESMISFRNFIVESRPITGFGVYPLFVHAIHLVGVSYSRCCCKLKSGEEDFKIVIFGLQPDASG